jgi:excisionase family DNA binding protein
MTKADSQDRAYLSVKEAARRAGVSVPFMYQRIRAGIGPAVQKRGRKILVLAAEFDDWLKQPITP